MKTKLTLVAIAILLIATLFGFAPTYGQNIHSEYFYIDTVEVSKKVICVEYPESKKTFTIFLDKMFDTLKFKDNYDALRYFLFIQIMPTFCEDDEYEKAARSVIKNTNWWLKDNYYQYW